MSNEQSNAIAVYEDDDRAMAPAVPLAAALAQSDVMAQIDAAHRHPRSIKAFLSRAKSMITIDQDVAESCMYALPRGKNDDGTKKFIKGASVRLAEIAASAYGNLQAGTRIVDVGDEFVTAQGVAWDMETNLRITVEVPRRITDSKNRRYGADMIGVTSNAAASIALRNALFKVIPRAYIDHLYGVARECAIGNVRTLSDQRTRYFDRFAQMGVSPERVLARLERVGIEDVTLDDLETLAGLGTAIKSGEITIEAAFPVATNATTATAPTPNAGRQRVVDLPRKATTAAPQAAPEPEDKRDVKQLRAHVLAMLARFDGESGDADRALFLADFVAGAQDDATRALDSVKAVQACGYREPLVVLCAALDRAFGGAA